MFLRGSILSMAVFGALTAAAAEPSTEACFAQHTVIKVVPQHATIAAGQGTYDRLVGARAYVPAKPGLTGEWLHALLARRSAEARSGTECPLDVPGVSINVRSAGPGFWVSLTSRDADDAKELLRRTQTLTR
ncbi:MAG TPA: hypothetical protein VMG12_03570 [Polyangiaceae bacterium]|nr:hypothetical protein [Polyangiaceae bacterium]